MTAAPEDLSFYASCDHARGVLSADNDGLATRVLFFEYFALCRQKRLDLFVAQGTGGTSMKRGSIGGFTADEG